MIDGFDDGGFDAVITNDAHSRLWLVQAKWSDRGSASIAVADAGKMRHGLTNILNSRFARFNQRFQRLVPDIDAAISNPNVRITLAVAVMGPGRWSRDVDDVFAQIRRDANSPQELVDIVPVGLADFHRIVRQGNAGAPIDLSIRLEGQGHTVEPYLAYQGMMPASAVAEWFSNHGQRLFEQNIRKALGVTPVNIGLVRTLVEEPHNFLYFNNGITVLCDSIGRDGRHGLNVGGPVDLHLKGVSVVNGAQTVASIHEAMQSNSAEASKAKVWLRLISLEQSPDGFAKSITLNTNTQNEVKPRDFVALDDIQLRLRDEFALSLGKTYVIKRGDDDPAPANGCSVAEAAPALACGQRDAGLLARVKRNPDVLYELTDRGPYHQVFGSHTNVYKVWRSVQLMRAVRDHLAQIREELEGRAVQIATHADLIVAHLVHHQIDPRSLEDPDFDWDQKILQTVPSMVTHCLDWLIHTFGQLYPDGLVQTVVKSQEKTIQLVAETLRSKDAGGAPLEPAYRKRRSRTVDFIVDGKLISDGTLVEFRAGSGQQRKLLAAWLLEDSDRTTATWVNDRDLPLVWMADGKRYSPSGLVKHMLSFVTSQPQRTQQGTNRWFVPERGSLADIANEGRIDDSE